MGLQQYDTSRRALRIEQMTLFLCLGKPDPEMEGAALFGRILYPDIPLHQLNQIVGNGKT